MNRKIFITFLLAQFVFLCINTVWAQGLDFYSRIDDEWNVLAKNLTKRHLEDYKTFRNFGKNCRGEIAWLDTKPIDQELLDEVSANNYTKLISYYHQAESKSGLTTEELPAIGSCLAQTYSEIKNRANSEQQTIENTKNIGIYMDGSVKNSDFDIIKDIEKINAIIFTVPFAYDGKKNNSEDLLKKFLNGDKPNTLSDDDQNQENNTNKIDSVVIKKTTDTNNSQTTITQDNSAQIPWAETCNADGTIGTTTIANMIDANFIRDLNVALSGNNSTISNKWLDYSTKPNQNIANISQNNSSQSLDQGNEDFSHKLPCNGIFCITIGTNIQNHTLLKGGKSYAIETILDEHIKKTEKISWSDLSGQKMTNNSFQLPFLNIKFKSKVAGGAVFVHNQPQVTKKLKDENTKEKTEDEFNEALRAATISAGLGTDEKTTSAPTGGFLHQTQGHTTENLTNSPVSANPIDVWVVAAGGDAQTAYRQKIQAKHYQGFSAQTNELQAFSDAMNDIIRQILDIETKLDSVPVQ